MRYLENVDLTYMLQPHGWSACYIFMDGGIYKLAPTHMFDDPIEIMLNGFNCMLRGGNEACFTWQDEPGEYSWRLERNPDQRHKVRISITNCFRVDASRDPANLIVDIEFEVKLKLFCTCILTQMQKVRALMEEPSFNQTRSGFPQATFKEFQTLFEQTYLSRFNHDVTNPIDAKGS